jgi:hypothetical protein
MTEPKIDPHEKKLQRDLDQFSVKLIKVIGAIGAIVGLAILIAFWYWVIKMLFKFGA